MPYRQAERVRQSWLRKTRGAAVGFALGAGLALSPFVWAQSPAAGAPATPAPQAAAMLPQQSFAPFVKRVLPAVVNISVTEKPEADLMSDHLSEQFNGQFSGPFGDFMRRFFNQHGGQFGPGPFSEGPGGHGGIKAIALGSGFIVDPSGYVVTNNHVVGEAAKVQVILQDGSKFPAKIVGRDPHTDLAVLQIKAGKPLPYVGFGDSSKAQVGDWVVAVGNPFGLGGSVTTGIISARGRDIHAGQFDDFLQIDAPINRGNSGGPTFNLSGQVIGINTAIYSPNGGSVGIGFAIPSDVAKHVVAQLESHGKVSRGWLGVEIQQVTPAIASSLGLKDAHGAIVAAVSAGSPAAGAGLKQGDVILSFDGHPVKQLRDLPRRVSEAAPGAHVTLTVWRGGQSRQLAATLVEAPENPQIASASGTPPSEQRSDALGMHLASLTGELRRELHVGRDVQGVVVSGIDSNSPADSQGVSSGDVLVSIDQQPVHSPEEAARRLREIARTRKSALLLINRHGVSQYVGVTLQNAG